MATADLARKLRSSILLEDELVPESEFDLPGLRGKLKEAKGKYRARHLAGYALPDFVRAHGESLDPTLKLTMSGQEARYTDPKYTDPKSDSYLGPDTIRALTTQNLQRGRDYLSRVTDKIGRLYDKDTDAARGAIDDLSEDVSGAEKRYEGRLTRAQALAAEERDLENYERKKAIDRRYDKSTGGAGDLTTLQLLGLQQDNPLGFAQLKGYTREAAPNGGKGYWFYKNNPDGTRTPVKVDEVANAIGGSRAALLADSDNPADQKLISGTKDTKPPTMSQETTALYATRIKQANDIFDKLSNYTQGLNPVTYTAQQKLPNFLNALRSGDFQSLDQAQRNFVNAVLRRESGAVISPAEFENAKLQYFPQPGDKPEVLKQKKANRDVVQKQFIQGASGAYVDDGLPTTTGGSWTSPSGNQYRLP